MPQWSRPVAISNQTSKTTSALALIQGQLHLVHLGETSDNLWHSVWNGTRWSDNTRIGKESSGRVAFANEGLLVYQSTSKESDGSRGLIYSLYQGYWTPSKPLPDRQTAADSPAAVQTSNSTWKVVRQVPSQGYLMGASSYGLRPGIPPAFPTVGFIDGGVLSEYSEKMPALATDVSGLHVIYMKEGSKDLWHSRGHTNLPIPNQSTRDTPAAASHNGVLHMTHIGAGSNTIWYSTFAGGQWTPNVPIPNHFSKKPPAMCSAPDGLHMVHKGAGSDRIWHSIYR